MIRPTLKFITACKALELIRFTDQHGTFWALVGERNKELLMLLVLRMNGWPDCENVMGQMDIPRSPFEKVPVLSYGSNYSIRVDHAGECEIGGIGKLISAPGAYVMTSQDQFICCRDTRISLRPAYYDLKTGNVRGEPGSERAVFAHWELPLISEGEPPTRLFQVHASKAPATAPIGPPALVGKDQCERPSLLA
jgi:hypothetical protein